MRQPIKCTALGSREKKAKPTVDEIAKLIAAEFAELAV
jgi:hypothetical protein